MIAVAGFVVAVVAVLALSTGLALAVRQRRVDHQTAFPTFHPTPPARRYADLRRNPADEETQEIPTVKETQ